jgi:hypothetical protein
MRCQRNPRLQTSNGEPPCTHPLFSSKPLTPPDLENAGLQSIPQRKDAN